MSYRSWLVERAPRWLRRKWGMRWLYATGTVLDAWREAALFAVKSRFPSRGPADALARQGEERLLDRMLGETDAGYIARLRRAFLAYREKGASRGLQNRLREAGYTTASVVEAHDWSTDDGESWARYWVVIGLPHGFSVSEVWEDAGLWDDAGVWLDPMSAAAFDQLRRMSRKWKAAYTRAVELIVVLTGDLWDYPGGTWSDSGTWSSTAAYAPI